MSQILYSFPKNAMEEVRASLTDYKGKKYIDLRVFYKGDHDEMKPSKKGLTLAPELIFELENALQKVKDAASEDKEMILQKGDYDIYKYRYLMAEAFHGYIASKEWGYVKQRVMERDDYRCVDCKTELPDGKGGVIHHEHYDDWGKGNYEEVLSCVYLCKKCHNNRHKQTDMKLKVPFWGKSKSIWAISTGLKEGLLEKTMKNLRTDHS